MTGMCSASSASNTLKKFSCPPIPTRQYLFVSLHHTPTSQLFSNAQPETETKLRRWRVMREAVLTDSHVVRWRWFSA
jgi:hypothetical protein